MQWQPRTTLLKGLACTSFCFQHPTFLARKDSSALSDVANGSPLVDELPFEATSKEAYFSRVETFTSLKWAGKPHELSPLICAKYGWSNIECDMLKCASCQAYLCASLQLAFDFRKYKERCLELRKALSAAHEKFCFWPDSPCPDRFSVLLVDEPLALFNEFLERFQSLVPLELQLPSLKPEALKSMSLTEETIGHLLQLIEDAECKTEGERTPTRRASDLLQIHITACVLALCGWMSSPPVGSVHLPLISCCRCMRKVGLWASHQIEAALPEAEHPFPPSGAPATPADGRPDKVPVVPTSPRRMITRSQDAGFPLGTEQAEKSPSPLITRVRSFDSSSSGSGERPDMDTASPATRTRPVTRSMGQSDACGSGAEAPSCPHRRAKRARLCSSGSSDSSARSFFDPISQHRDWCPWVNTVKEMVAGGDRSEEMADLGWQVVLKALQASRPSDRPAEVESENLSVKSRKVFRIFRQWEATCSP
ncbi:nuclear-interacting partner of ALK isoform X2 [Varanus komodoensis]|uniref:nuclear-interacting partner of ALK isoform X2 n=1 Tax=Varanus komodoensis TaxID=61221 RepID=UPI001CF78466|nr:nuclear-interacting partner of ALK isoform X2 [Varanus komodoensis]XP_044285126.1 nuclear-interacting partner of ALK isoform X2 [Varanus komodoensis]